MDKKKTLIVVAGLPCAGKSYYINKCFSSFPVIDLYSFQKGKILTVERVLRSYDECRQAVIDTLQQNDIVILEHPLVKKARRMEFLQGIKDAVPVKIYMHWIKPNFVSYCQRVEERGLFESVEACKENYHFQDVPTKNEGYESLEIVDTAHTCGDCRYFTGMGDWDLCCERPHPDYACGFLCYADSFACEQYALDDGDEADD